MLVEVVVLAFLHLASAETQTPTTSSCSENPDNDVISISDLKVSDAEIGKTMHFDYTMDITKQIGEDPLLVFDMLSEGSTVPCYENAGSCIYSMCEGTTDVEKQIGAPWDNKCPIQPGTYHNELGITIPSDADAFITDPKVHVKIQGLDDDEETVCVEFDVTVKGVKPKE